MEDNKDYSFDYFLGLIERNDETVDSSDDKMTPQMKNRFNMVATQLHSIYHTPGTASNPNAWTEIFNGYKYQEDWYNKEFVIEFINRLEHLTDIDESVWIYFGSVLFEEDAIRSQWKDVRKHFLEVKKTCVSEAREKKVQENEARKRARESETGKHVRESETERHVSKQNSRPKNKTAGKLYGILLFGIIGFIISTNWFNYSKHTEDSDYDYNVTVPSISVEIPTMPDFEDTYKDVFKKVYTENSPFLRDVDGDNVSERIYYDKESDTIVICKFTENGVYEPLGTLLEYIEAHPEGNYDSYLLKIAK